VDKKIKASLRKLIDFMVNNLKTFKNKTAQIYHFLRRDGFHVIPEFVNFPIFVLFISKFLSQAKNSSEV